MIFLLIQLVGKSPKDHKERLKKELPNLYQELDIEFSTYRDTYSKIIDKDTCERIKSIVENDLKEYKIKE